MAAQPSGVRAEILSQLEPVWIDLPARLRAGARTFEEAGGTQAYFGDPAVATAADGRRLIGELGSIICASYLEARAAYNP
jgi:hypothetical protein